MVLLAKGLFSFFSKKRKTRMVLIFIFSTKVIGLRCIIIAKVVKRSWCVTSVVFIRYRTIVLFTV